MITFKLTKEESQKILDALVKEPYIEVVEVINELQEQASTQMEDADINQEGESK